MNQKMECMCTKCGVSIYLSAENISMEDSSADTKILDSLLVCDNCGGQLQLVGKAGDESFYRLK